MTIADFFDGDIKELNLDQIKFIHEVFDREGFSGTKIKFQPVGKKGDNYVADVSRLTAEKDGRSLSLIAKIAPKAEQLRMMVNTGICFKNETIMYNEVLPKFIDMQIEAGVPENERLKYPTFYGAITEEPNEVILLEDLNTSGFTIRDRFGSLTNEEIKLVLRNQATIHSLGFVLKERDPDLFHEIDRSLINLWDLYSQVEEFKGVWMAIAEQASKFVAPECQKKVRDILVSNIDIGVNLRKSEENSKYITILQGDSWTNNIMFTSGVDAPLECVLIDYQISKVGSPVSDILYALFNCTDRELRQKHFYEWIDHYHKVFDDSLANFNMKAATVYPRDKLDADLLRYGKQIYGTSVFLANILTRESDEVKDMKDFDPKDTKEIDEYYSTSAMKDITIKRYEKKIVELTQCCTEYGYLI